MYLKVKSVFKSNLALYAFLYGGSAAILKIIGFALFLFFARELTTAEYASFGLMYSLQTAISTFSIAGIVELIIANLHRDNKKVLNSNLFQLSNTIFLIFTLISCLFIFILYLEIKNFNSESAILMAVVILNAAAITYTMYCAQLVRLLENHKHSLFFSFIIPFLSMVFGIIGFLKFKNISSFFASSFLGFLLPIIISIKNINLRFEFDKVKIKNGILFCLPFIAMAFFNWISGYGNNQILNLIFPKEAIASFTFLYSISAIMQLVATALNQVWSPKFYGITHSELIEIVENKNYRFYGGMSILLGLVGGIVVILLPFLTNYIGGNAGIYSQNKLYLFLLLSAYIILPPWWHCQNYFLAYNKGIQLFKITTISTIIGMSLSILLMLLVGEVGVYLGFFIVMLLRVWFIVKKAKHYWQLKLSWLCVFLGLLLFSTISFLFY